MSKAASKQDMDPDELDELDRAILDYLQEGRADGDPWGVGTPVVVREALKERGVSVPTRQTINDRLKVLAKAGVLNNRFGKGEYELVEDPRE